MFFRNKNAKIFLILFSSLCVFICIFLFILGPNDIEQENKQNKIAAKNFDLNDFGDLPDELSDALRVLLESGGYPSSFTYIFEYLASEEYKNLLKKMGPKSNGVFVRLGDWVFEFQTGAVIGFCWRGDDSVNIIGTINFDKNPRDIKLKIKNIEHVRRK